MIDPNNAETEEDRNLDTGTEIEPQYPTEKDLVEEYIQRGKRLEELRDDEKRLTQFISELEAVSEKFNQRAHEAQEAIEWLEAEIQELLDSKATESENLFIAPKPEEMAARLTVEIDGLQQRLTNRSLLASYEISSAVRLVNRWITVDMQEHVEPADIEAKVNELIDLAIKTLSDNEAEQRELLKPIQSAELPSVQEEESEEEQDQDNEATDEDAEEEHEETPETQTTSHIDDTTAALLEQLTDKKKAVEVPDVSHLQAEIANGKTEEKPSSTTNSEQPANTANDEPKEDEPDTTADEQDENLIEWDEILGFEAEEDEVELYRNAVCKLVEDSGLLEEEAFLNSNGELVIRRIIEHIPGLVKTVDLLAFADENPKDAARVLRIVISTSHKQIIEEQELHNYIKAVSTAINEASEGDFPFPNNDTNLFYLAQYIWEDFKDDKKQNGKTNGESGTDSNTEIDLATQIDEALVEDIPTSKRDWDTLIETIATAIANKMGISDISEPTHPQMEFAKHMAGTGFANNMASAARIIGEQLIPSRSRRVQISRISSVDAAMVIAYEFYNGKNRLTPRRKKQLISAAANVASRAAK